MIRRAVWIGLAAWGLAAVSGCGYTLGYRTPPGARTIAIPVFHNGTFPLRRDIEHELTSEVRRTVHARTPLRVVSEEGADLILRGRIVEFREAPRVEGAFDEKIESLVLAVVDLELEDYRNDYRARYRVRTTEPFSEAAGESFATGRSRAFGNLAERIVARIEYWDDYEDASSGDGQD